MDSDLINGVLLGFAGYLLLVWLLLRAIHHKKRKEQEFLITESRSHSAQDNQTPSWLDCLKVSGVYWGVRIQAQEGTEVCQQIQPMLGNSYPLQVAPPLPHRLCQRKRCRCYFQPLVERRSNRPRRIHSERRFLLRYEPPQRIRRSSGDRRKAASHPPVASTQRHKVATRS